MATVAQLKERAASLLPPGSEVQQAFVCQTATNFVIFVINWLTGLTLGLITYRCVAVTSDAIYVLDPHRLSGGATPRSVVATLPRHTQLGPVHGRWSELALLGDRHSPRPAGVQTSQKQHAGLLELDAQPSVASIRLP